MVGATGEAAYAGVWMGGGCSRETTWACDSETLALEAFVIVVHHAAVRRMAGLGEQSLEVGREEDLGKAWWNYLRVRLGPLRPRFPSGHRSGRLAIVC